MMKRNEIEAKVQSLAEEYFGVHKDDFTVLLTFKELDADSLGIMEVVMDIEDTFDITIPDEKIDGIETMTDLINLIEQSITTKEASSE